MSSPAAQEGSNQPPAPPAPAPKGRRPISRRRKWLFRLAAVTLVPALVFCTLELALRLAGYGLPTDYFLDGSKAGSAGVWVDNPDFGRRFFPRSLREVPHPTPFALPKLKSAGTYRIFVLGESAALGFPDPSTGFARVLGAMLRARYPGTRFEVVNTSMVAINSHVALTIAEEGVRREPDLLVVHLGNNEVVGPFGAVGVLGPFSPSLGVIRANLAVKTTRTGQLLDRGLQGLGRGDQAPREWDGMGMFVNSRVRADDPRLAQIHAHFRDNLRDICRAAEAAGIPVVLCTIPVNLKDSPPFASLHAADLGGDRAEAWDEAYRDGVRLEDEGKFAEAVRCYERADQIDGGYADLAYRLGRCFAALGDAGQARRNYVRACDLDALPFRSVTSTNDEIRDVAAHAGAGVRLADADRAFARASPGEVPGDDLFLEHVHMTFQGNYLLARTVFETLSDPAPAALGTPAKETAGPLSEAECAARLAATEWNEWKFGTKIYELLLQGPPFTSQLDHEARCRRWKEKLDARQARLRSGGLAKAADEYRKAIRLTPGDWMLLLNLGQLLAESGRLTEAKEQYEAALVQLPHCVAARYLLGNTELRMGRPEIAEAHFQAVLRREPDHLEAHLGLAESLEGQGRTAEATALFEEQVRQNPWRALPLEAMGRFLYRTGKLDEAKARLTEALEREPWNAAIHVDLGMTALKAGNTDEAIAHFEEAQRLQPDWPELRDHLAELRAKRDRR